jgi:hypothetical protein
VSEVEIQGEEPTAADQFWLTVAADDLTPVKSLQRITDKVGFIFANLTLAGTVLAGAGIIAGAKAGTQAHPALLMVLIVLVFASVAAALLANLPSMQSEINPADPDAIRQHYERAIRWKGWFTRFALLFFSAALVLAFILVISTTDRGPTVQISMQWTPLSSGRLAELHATVQATGLSEQSVGETTLTAFRAGGSRVVLSRGMSDVHADGTLAFSAGVTAAATAFRSLVLSVTVTQSGREVESRSMTLSLKRAIRSKE